MDREEKSKLIWAFVFILIISVILTSTLTTKYIANKYGIEVLKEEASSDSTENIQQIATNLRNFRELVDKVYIGEIDEDKLMDETLKGYINGLGDEYSAYMTKEEWDEFQTSALGNYKGIGVYISEDKNGNVVIASVIEGTPAEEAGLLAEDIFVEVNGESVIGETIDSVSSMIKGEAGTKVNIKVLRGTEYKSFDVERREIKVYHVQSKLLENNIGYIELITYDEGCANEVLEAYKTLKAQGAKKFILDLRYNTGGLVEEALSLLDSLLPKNETMLITKDANGKEEITKSTSDQLISEEMVVLVNGYSASASEITVGALKDAGRATIVGTKTYGKGVIQNVYMLTDGSVLKLTVNEYFTPKGNKINKLGIEPDVVVEISDDDTNDVQLEKAEEILNSNN